MKQKLRKILQFLLNPRLVLCIAIAWIITNGWSYVLFAVGTWLDIGWMTAVGGAYMAFLWLPISPEKLVTFTIAIALLRWWFPDDKKTLAVLRHWYRKAKEAIGKKHLSADQAESERLLLIPMTPAELEVMAESCRQSDPDLSSAYSEMLAGCLAHPAHAEWYTAWKMVEKDTGETVGDLCFKGLEHGVTEIGYGVLEAFQQQGYATEAVAALCQWAFATGKVRLIEAETEPDNLPSQRVLQHCGFVPTGTSGAEGPRFRLENQNFTGA